MNSKYKTISKQVKNITDKERMEIVSLYLRYYDGSSPAQVIYDLENKTEIILMLLDDKIVGFTTLEFYQRIWNEKTIGIVYSGDTIIEREHWGQQSLTFACITRMGQYKQENPEMPLLVPYS